MFEDKSLASLQEELQCNFDKGLTDEEVVSRRAKYGENKLTEKKKKSIFRVFIEQFIDPMVLVLFIAALISLIIGLVQKDNEQYIDVIIIFAVVLLNAGIGTYQEAKAEKALEALKKMSSPTATVKRNGKIMEIKASELVPGDLVILEEGRTVPADLRLIKSFSLKTDESSLTGESNSIDKDASFVLTDKVGVGDRVNECFMSTPVVYGRGEGIVIATGMNTEIGRIASMISDGGEETTPLQKKLAGLSKFLGIMTVIIVVLMLFVGLIWDWAKGTIAAEWSESLLASVSLAVAAIPEGLPAVVTIVLALGVGRMVKVNTIVRKLASVETLGSVSVICSDKTGTLTQNKMTVVAVYDQGKYYDKEHLNDKNLEFLAKGMALCSNASVENGVYGDPTEVALVNFAESLGMKKSVLENVTPRVDELPFDSVRKMMSTKHKEGDTTYVYTKGALDQILKHCKYILKDNKVVEITDKDKKEAMANSEKMSQNALRVLAFAYKTGDVLSEEELIFVGFVGMVDPPREAAKPAVQTLKGAGIRTVMITGDHKDTAFAIAKELHIVEKPEECMSGDEIDALSEDELKKKVEHVSVFARVSPENKVQIVKALKGNGHIVAMTGDGVNDAPSLKAADIGIAMGITGTDVAKGAADMVLTDDNFASIEKAVEEGRGIYANIRKTILFLLSCNIGEVLCMFVATLIGLPAPLIAVHLLWVNLVTDSFPAIALGSDKKPDDIMKDKPRDPKESLFAHGGFLICFGYGAVIGLMTLLAFLLPAFTHGHFLIGDINNFYSDPLLLEEGQSMAFCVLSFSQLFHMLGMTDVKHSFVRVFKDNNKMLWFAFFVGLALQFFVIEVPGVNSFFSVLPLHDKPIDYLYVFVLALMPLVVHEIAVLVLYIKRKVTEKKAVTTKA